MRCAGWPGLLHVLFLAQPLNPSSSDAARHARPKRARLLQPRQPQLRVERALALAHAARPSQGLRPAARLSARRQRTVLHSPPTLLLPLRHGTRGRSALGCRGRAMRSCGSSARSRSRTRPGLRRVCGPQLTSPPDGSAPFCIAPQPFFFRRSTLWQSRQVQSGDLSEPLSLVHAGADSRTSSDADAPTPPSSSASGPRPGRRVRLR